MGKVIVIVGPTGVGKTKLSIELAKKLNGEIINADSTIIYKHLDIATAKPTKEERQNIKHHLIDIKELTEDYSVFDYQKDCRKKIDEILKREKTPIIVGGTGLYIKASLYDYKFEKNEIHNDYEKFSNEQLYKMLKEIDSKTIIHQNNRKRVIRALQYYDSTKEAFSDKEITDKLLYDTVIIGLTTSRETLYERINNRVDQMMKEGLLNEAKTIYDFNIRSKSIMTPIGYKELFPYFERQEKLENCIEKIKQNSRRYAKRQYTWFKNQLKVNWIEVDFDNFENTIEQVYEIVK